MTLTAHDLAELKSTDWRLAVAAVKRVGSIPGRTASRALAQALDAQDTAVTEAAIEALLARDDPTVTDLIWEALCTLDDDLGIHMWAFLADHPQDPVVQELERRYRRLG
jgi:HEAT repeat protein